MQSVEWDLDARRAFGRPIISRRSISTAVIVGRVDAGESVDDIAADYELKPEEVQEAIEYEQAA